jgi:uncharacterized protein (DUF4415 family)
VPKRPDPKAAPGEDAPLPTPSGELLGSARPPRAGSEDGSPPSVRDAEPDRPYTLRLNKAVMRDFESWVRARGKRKKPVIEAALREYMARHADD